MLTPLIHYDSSLEKAVIGACIVEKFAFSRIYGLITPKMFRETIHSVMFSVLTEMYEDSHPIDIVTVPLFVAKRNKKLITEYNIPATVIEVTKMVTSTANLEYHAIVLRDMYVKRRMLELQMDILNTGNGVDDLETLRQELDDLAQLKVTDDWESMSDVIYKLNEHMDRVHGKDLIGVTSGFKLFDSMTSGFTTGMFIIGARPSVGKSALLNTMVLAAANAGKKVGIINLEMSQEEIGGRLSSLVTDLDFNTIFRNRLRDEQERIRFYSELDTLVNLPIKISSTTGVNGKEIRAKATKLKNTYGLDILFIDYLQLIDGDSSNKNFSREVEVAKLSRGIKLTSMELGIPIVALCQLNRETMKSADKKPQLHHLRESGSIEQDADGVIFLHRDWKVGIETNADGQSTENEADIIIAKWRNGKTGEIKIGFDPPKMKYFDLTQQNNFIKPYKPEYEQDAPF